MCHAKPSVVVLASPQPLFFPTAPISSSASPLLKLRPYNPRTQPPAPPLALPQPVAPPPQPRTSPRPSLHTALPLAHGSGPTAPWLYLEPCPYCYDATPSTPSLAPLMAPP